MKVDKRKRDAEEGDPDSPKTGCLVAGVEKKQKEQHVVTLKYKNLRKLLRKKNQIPYLLAIATPHTCSGNSSTSVLANITVRGDRSQRWVRREAHLSSSRDGPGITAKVSGAG